MKPAKTHKDVATAIVEEIPNDMSYLRYRVDLILEIAQALADAEERGIRRAADLFAPDSTGTHEYILDVFKVGAE